MIIPLILMALSVLVLLLTNNHVLLGAVILGINAVGMDLLWQILRMRLVKKENLNQILLAVTGGFLIRILSIFIFIQIAKFWLDKSVFSVFALILLSIPLFSIVLAYKFRLERN